jgi:CDP-diacylglycerol--serine O-phosphatidyltransferase
MKPLPRPVARRVVVLMPSGFTLANLFFGVWAIVSAYKGELNRAGLFVLLGGVADALDGRVARATGTDSRFGEELDSLVDAVSFGVAPAMIMYFAVLNHEGFDFIWAFLYIAAAVIRLARFNIEQAGRAKRHFYGLPSPAAGMTLATYYWFVQSPLYASMEIKGVPWQQMMRYLMGVLSLLMMSNVQYPAVPVIGFRTWRDIFGTAVVFGAVLGVVLFRWEFFFPALLTYVVYGVAKTALLGLMDRRASRDGDMTTPVEGVEPTLDDEAPGEPGDAPLTPERFGRRRRRRPRGNRPWSPGGPPSSESAP